MEGMIYLPVLDCSLSTKVLEGALFVLELLKGVRHILDAVGNSEAVRTAGDAPRTEVLKVVLEVVRKVVLEVVMEIVLEGVPKVVKCCVLFTMLEVL